MDRKQKHTLYMRKYRASLSEKEKLAKRKRDNEYKKRKRRTDPEWLEIERTRRRMYGKIKRYRNKEKDKVLREKYRKENIYKEKARLAILYLVQKGKIIRPEECEICGETPEPFNDPRAKSGKRYPLRADHYKGYGKENWLKVKWICKDCDGKQLRSKNPLVTT